MLSKKMSLSDAKLYLILDREVNTYDELIDIAQRAVPAGVDIVQLRDKLGAAKDILNFARRLKDAVGDAVPFIINDRVDLAQICNASGVHLGQDDIPLLTARKMLGPDAIIGISCQNIDQACKAVDEGADYIGFGSVFKTLTKPERNPMDLELLKKVSETNDIPVFAIGGIDENNLSRLRSLGVSRVAVCRSICKADNIGQAAEIFKSKLHAANI